MANYKISSGFTDTQDNLKDFSDKHNVKDSGPYIGVVKNTIDPLKMGRLGVVIPALSKTDGHDINAEQVIWCQYLSPFYGAKPFKANTVDGDSGPQQRSYGMWAIPPDVDTNVLVIFAKGETSQKNAFWIGCIQEPLTNQQIPGMGSSENTYNNTNAISGRERGIAANAGQKVKNYGTNFLPVEEKNKKAYSQGESIEAINKWKFPVNDVLAEQLFQEGLIKDDVRGTTSSSARRETPSQVFGWSTPGGISEDSRVRNIGLDNTPISVDRDLGHCFVLDDGDKKGNNRLARIRTSSGHQLLMHDTEGVVYLANGSGKAYIEMSKDGTISIFSAAGINIRSGGDFNLHSDRDINFHAKQRIRMVADINIANSAPQLYNMGKYGIFNASQESAIQSYAKGSIMSHADGSQLHSAGGRMDLKGSRIDLNSGGRSAPSYGCSWLTPEHENVAIIVTDGKDIDVEKPIKEGGDPNTLDVKTTVSDFVTHEPYARQSSQARKKKYINGIMEEIKKSNPEMSSAKLKEIKETLLANKTVVGVSNQVKKLVALNDEVNLKVEQITGIVDTAKNLENVIKQEALGFVQGMLSGNITESVAQIKQYATIAENFFLGSKTGPAGMYRNPSGISTAIKSAGAFISKLKFW
jgi:hypothetical protein